MRGKKEPVYKRVVRTTFTGDEINTNPILYKDNKLRAKISVTHHS
ncbi:hypothetical protein VCHA32O87_490001 [Vibrio chagasii]|nr:hypothetical protein VCHA34P115_390003 [Vibrio chagasii]CAH6957416.1 hypothetical protein VCHA32O87_490001 [Vibrio chagasii]CAH7221920.1 hypothetical protein VCHA41O246_330001 [Vibrio chagasii]CAH7278860.1 hypothetical protein VCHA40O236_520001 [Vibrio chagasii]CAH7315753.1 hypothetical protein VCHA53O474_370001 [Vibrio chagasii]